MSASNLILYLPFDEPNGSNVAYDHSPSRADAVLHSSSFVSGHIGNAIEFRDGAHAEVTHPILEDLNCPFSVSFYISPAKIETGDTNVFTWFLNLSNSEHIVYELRLPLGVWTHLTLSHRDGEFIFFVDGKERYRTTTENQLLGLSLNQNYYGGDYSCCRLDDFRIYNEAIEKVETQGMDRQIKSTYTIDGVDFKEYGVFVSESDGIINRPKLKTFASVSWDNYHGEDVDLNHKYYEPREITLSCFIKAKTKNDFIVQISRFEQLFDKRGLHRLVINVHPTKPLIYEVYCKDEISISKKWSEGLMVGTFKLKLTEPQPVKRVLKHICVSEATKSCTINITTPKYVNIFWGDGTVDEDISGRDVQVSHNYKDNGEYFPVITGCIDEIESFQTDAIIVWNKL